MRQVRSQWNNDDEPTAWGDAPAQSGRGLSGKVIAIAGGVVAVVLVIAFVAAMTAKGSDSDAAPAADSSGGSPETGTTGVPSDGVYSVGLASADQCLVNGPEKGNDGREVTVLGDCGDVYPMLTLTRAESGGYTVGMDFSEDDWQACLTVDSPGDDTGYLVAGQDCEDGSALQTFTLKPLDELDFAIVTSTGMCLEPLNSTLDAGTALATADCDDSAAPQRFRFTPAE